jgi:circadian clock protein KaiC
VSESRQRTGDSLVLTGVAGLDDVLGGGVPPHHLYLVEGNPGTGKTTLGLQFAIQGAQAGERVLYITLAETRQEQTDAAAAHGWSLEGVDIMELVPSQELLDANAQLTMFHPSEVQLAETTRSIVTECERVQPAYVVIDSLSELRMLSEDGLRYRHQILALKQFFAGKHCTVLLLDDPAGNQTEFNLRSLVHGVVELEHLALDFGPERRRLRLIKLRGRSYRGGYHDFRIRRGGLDVFPRLVAAEHLQQRIAERVPSGVTGLDALVGGGLDRGTSTLLMGPAGSGKSTLAVHYAIAAAERGQRSVIFAFDESPRTLLIRSAAMEIPLQRHIDAGLIAIQQVDPAEMSPGEFTHVVRQVVGQGDKAARVVVVDSLNGYMHAMPDERFLTLQLHELLSYLGQQGVLTLLVVAQHGVVGTGVQAPIDASYLADTVILLRYFEARGRLRRAISVVKKRSGSHEDTIRELRMGPTGIVVGQPILGFQGILTGVPTVLSDRFSVEDPR